MEDGGSDRVPPQTEDFLKKEREAAASRRSVDGNLRAPVMTQRNSVSRRRRGLAAAAAAPCESCTPACRAARDMSMRRDEAAFASFGSARFQPSHDIVRHPWKILENRQSLRTSVTSVCSQEKLQYVKG